jgi:hypothetical protein
MQCADGQDMRASSITHPRMHVFDRYYKRRWPKDPSRKGAVYGERKAREGSEDEQEVELLGQWVCVRSRVCVCACVDACALQHPRHGPHKPRPRSPQGADGLRVRACLDAMSSHRAPPERGGDGGDAQHVRA